jgi:hypothetical protein
MVVNPSAWQGITVTFNGTTVGRIKKVPAPQFSAEDIDITDQDSNGIKQFIPGLKEGNEIEFILNDIPSDTGQQALDAAATAGTTGTFILTFPTGRTVSFDGAVKTFDLIEDNKATAISCKVKVTGTITRGATNKQNLTTLTVTPSSGSATLFPTPFAATTYEYTCSVLNAAATVDFIPTSTSATSITVNSEVITASNTSATIDLTAGAIKKVNIIVQRTGYLATNYTFWVCRAAT